MTTDVGTVVAAFFTAIAAIAVGFFKLKRDSSSDANGSKMKGVCKLTFEFIQDKLADLEAEGKEHREKMYGKLEDIDRRLLSNSSADDLRNSIDGLSAIIREEKNARK